MDGTQITRASRIPVVPGSTAAAAITVVLVQACSTSAATAAAVIVLFQAALPWFRSLPRLSANGSSLSNTPKTKNVDMREST